MSEQNVSRVLGIHELFFHIRNKRRGKPSKRACKSRLFRRELIYHCNNIMTRTCDILADPRSRNQAL